MDVGMEMANHSNEAIAGSTVYDVIIAGGGMAGLTAAILLAEQDFSVLLIEKKKYPFHKVCGEYISNEIIPFLIAKGIDLQKENPAAIERLRITGPSGNILTTGLKMGGTGISRYRVDQLLSEQAQHLGAEVLENTRINEISFTDDAFNVTTLDNRSYYGKFVIGSYGKREKLDKKLSRKFISKKTGYMAVKYHISTDYPGNEIGLHNFRNGYCGISKIEGDRYCLCYLSKRENMQQGMDIKGMEEAVLYKNPALKSIFQNAEFHYSAPLVINEISFSLKELVHHHILMCGDSAGMITPLCGNGMSMAVHGAKMLSDLLIKAGVSNNEVISGQLRAEIETAYARQWNKQFLGRMKTGQLLQPFFGDNFAGNLFLKAMHRMPLFKNRLINKTHGKPVY